MNSPLIRLIWEDVALRIVGFYVAAWLVNLLAWRIAGIMLRLGLFSAKHRELRPQRQATLRHLIASAVRSLAFVAATLASIGQFVRPETLIWLVGLFSVAFGLGARPLVSDFMAGFYLIFEDQFSVGDKIEVLEIEGVVEAVSLRTTTLRGPRGNLYIIPNGEIRVVRNFSRGQFSRADVTLKLASRDLQRALPVLEQLGQEAVHLLPSLIEPWKVISEKGVMGQHTELTLLVRARFGEGAELRPRLLALVYERLSEAEVTLGG
jgi:small conductance mechanosensitive channel